MKKLQFNAPGLYISPYFPRAIKISGQTTTIYMSGMTPADEEYLPVHEGDIAAQYKYVVDACGRVLAQAGAGWADVVMIRTYLVDYPSFMGEFKRGKITIPGVPGRAPCSTMIAVQALSHPGFLVEMELIAVVESEG